MKKHILYLDHHGTEKILCRFPVNFNLPKNYVFVKIWKLLELFKDRDIDDFESYVKEKDICLKCAKRFVIDEIYL